MNVIKKACAGLLLAQFGPLALFALMAPASLTPAYAQSHTTCTVEGTMMVDKKPVPSRDCFENAGAPQEDFQRVCDAMAQTAIAVTTSTGAPAPKISYGDSCPSGAVAKCKGFLFMPILHHIFKRSEHEIEVARESCLTQNGEWTQQ